MPEEPEEVVPVPVPVPAPSDQVPVDDVARRLTRWAWVMALLFFVAIGVTGMLGYAATAWLGLADGELLPAAGAAGWAVAAGLLALQFAPPAAGAVLGAKALRAGGGAAAGSALAVNALLGLYALVVEVFQLSVG